MFDLGWPEMLVIAIVLIVVVGPKDLPKMLRTFGKTTSSLRKMAGDFRKQFDEALKEAELDDIKSTIDSARKLNPAADIKKALNPMEKAAADVRAGLDDMMKPKPKVPAPDAPALPTEPAKAGPTAMPGEGAAATKPVAATPAPKPAATTAPPVAKPAPAAKPVAKAPAKAPAPKPAKSVAAAPAKKPSAEKPSAEKPAARKPASRKTSGAAS